MDELEEAARERAAEIGVPDALDAAWPVVVGLFGRTEAKEMRLRFTHMASEAAAR